MNEFDSFPRVVLCWIVCFVFMVVLASIAFLAVVTSPPL